MGPPLLKLFVLTELNLEELGKGYGSHAVFLSLGFLSLALTKQPGSYSLTFVRQPPKL